MKECIVILLCVILTSCGSSGNDSPTPIVVVAPVDDAPGNDLPEDSLLTSLLSAYTGIDYPVSIYVPTNYAQSDETYDVIYASDGQWSFDEYSSIIRNRDLDIILVNIHQGPEGRRNIDYLLPGAREFFNVIVDELIPFIEQQYRVDSSNRTFVGASYGGILVSNLLLLDDGDGLVFKNLLSMDAPFLVTHRQATTELLEERYNLSPNMQVNLMLTSALLPASIGGFDKDVSAFQQQLEEKGFQGLNISRYAYSVDHFNISGPSFSEVLLEYFGE